MNTNDEMMIQALAAEGLDNMIVTFQGRGIDITESLCILRLQNGQVITICGGTQKVPVKSTALSGLVGLLEIIESSYPHDSVAQQDVVALRESVLDYVRRLDGLSEDTVFSVH